MTESRRPLEQILEENAELRRQLAELKAAAAGADPGQAAYQKLFHELADAVVVAETHTGQIVDVNHQAELLCGWRRDELVGRPLSSLHPAAEQQRYDQVYRSQLSAKNALLEGQIVTKDGQHVPVAIVASAMADPDQQRMLWVFRRAAAEQAAEKERREQQARLSAFMEAASDAFYLLDANLNFVDANQRAVQLVGMSKEQLIGQNIADVVPNVKESGRYDRHLEVLRTGEPFVATDLVPHPKFGELHAVLKSFKVGSGLGVIVSDVSELRRSEAALRKSEELHRTLVSALPDAVIMTDLQARITYASPQFAKLLGYADAEQLRGQDGFVFVVPEEQEQARHGMRTTLQHGMGRGASYTFVRRDGSRFPGEVSAAVIRDGDGQPEAFIVVVRDVSDRKRRESLIRAQRDLAVGLSAVSGLDEALEECLHAALEVSGLDSGGIYLVDEHTGALELACSCGLSDEFLQRVSYLTADTPNARVVFGGKPVYARYAEMPVPAHPVELREALHAIAVIPIGHETRIIGCLNVASHTLDVVPHENREALETLGAQIGSAIARIRAEEAKLAIEEQLRQSQKLEAIGTLAGGIAHDFNNLLTGILGSASLIKLRAEPGSELHGDTEVIETAAVRASELTRQLLGFARKGKLRNEAVDVHAVIHDVMSILKHTIDKRIRIECSTEARASLVMGDPSQLQQVILNLAVNASEAMPEGGTLSVGTAVVEKRSAEDRGPAKLAAGRYLVIRVADTGHGMPAEIQARVFEPFFTTKQRGQGTGMGLAVAYGIISSHGGGIELVSEPNRGALFTVYLPAAPDTAEVLSPDSSVTPSRGRGRILVVDDEQVVCRVAARMLRSLGYQVDSAHDGQAAIEHFRQHGQRIDLVILDLAMPVMSGRECFRLLQETSPEVRVLISSGHAVDHDAQQMLAQGARGFVQKPYVLQELAAAVAQALQDQSPTGASAPRRP
jgi:PAS domain S-box-containing protein